jgi:long-chain acyl-CoA synthetase
MDSSSITGILRTQSNERPDETMFRFLGDNVTWAEHHQRASKVGQALQSDGVGPGDRVAFLDRNGLAYFEVLFGGALTGAVNVAVNWRLAPEEMAGIVDDSRAKVLVVHPDFVPCLAGMASGLPHVSRVVVLGDPKANGNTRGAADLGRRVGYEDWLADRPDSDPGYEGAEEDVCLQLYTSGTTGLPKGVMLTHGNLAAQLSGAPETFGISDSSVSLVAMPLFHIGGSGWALAGMSRGGASVIAREIDPAGLLTTITSEKVTHCFLVPAFLMALLAVPDVEARNFSNLDTVFYGASPIAEEVLVRCLELFRCNFAQVYGMTETTGAIVRLDPEDHDPSGKRRHLLRSAGKPLEGVELRIVDPDSRRDVPVGTVGEVWTRSAYNMLGYWNKPEETRATLSEDGWLRTGDAGYMDDEGYLFLHDRIKDMVVSGGENIYPAEVENILLSHSRVADAAVIGVPDERWGEAVKAIVVPTEEGAVDPAELIAYCREHLAHYKCPKTVDFAKSLPRNPSGKILKRELREPYWEDQERRVH